MMAWTKNTFIQHQEKFTRDFFS